MGLGAPPNLAFEKNASWPQPKNRIIQNFAAETGISNY
jgi:hypothetical protein